MSFFKPDFIFDAVSDISPDLLTQHNIRAIILDLDGTLCHSRSDTPSNKVIEWLDSIKARGIKIFLLSNNRHIHRVEKFCSDYDLPIFSNRAKKPFKSGFLKAAAALDVPHGSIAVIGDQIFTDVLGGNMLGMNTFFVFSLDYSIWYIRLRHILEKPFLKKQH